MLPGAIAWQHSAVLVSIIEVGFPEMLEYPIPPIIDDLSLREAVPDLIRARGLAAKVFESADDLLAPKDHHRTSCLIVDMPLSGMSGVDLRHCLVMAENHEVPLRARRDTAAGTAPK